MAHTGSYAITILLQDRVSIGNQFSFANNRSAPPISFLGDLDDRLELCFDNLGTLARLTLFQGFSDA